MYSQAVEVEHALALSRLLAESASTVTGGGGNGDLEDIDRKISAALQDWQRHHRTARPVNSRGAAVIHWVVEQIYWWPLVRRSLAASCA
jgi:hypothetical protein